MNKEQEQVRQQALAMARAYLETAEVVALPHSVAIAGIYLALESMATAHECCTELVGRDLLHLGLKLIDLANNRTNVAIH